MSYRERFEDELGETDYRTVETPDEDYDAFVQQQMDEQAAYDRYIDQKLDEWRETGVKPHVMPFRGRTL